MKEKGISLIMVLLFMTILLFLASTISISTRRRSYDALEKEDIEKRTEKIVSISKVLNQDTVSSSSIWFDTSLPKDKTKVVNYIFIENTEKEYKIGPLDRDGLSKAYVTLLAGDKNLNGWKISIEDMTLGNTDKEDGDKFYSYISSEVMEKNREYTVKVSNGELNNEYIVLIRIFHE